MTTHLLYKNQDPDFPVSLSEKLISGILRRDLGFRGVVISDDLSMKAISNKYSASASAKLAFKAGTDLLMIAGDKKSSIKLIKRFFRQ